MICTNPTRLMNPSNGQIMHVGCGKCYGCLVNRRRAWLLRLKNELKYSSSGYHLTLQLDDDHLGDNVVKKEVIQRFIKRLRKAGLKCRYYAIGEYGTNDRRAHYHVALFLKQDMTFEEFHDLVWRKWTFGYIFITKLNQRRMNYVLHYHVRPKEVDGRKTFAVCSNGLGSEWYDDNELSRWLVESGRTSITVDGNRYVIPRYYRKKVGAPAADSPTRVYDFRALACQILGYSDFFDIPLKKVEKLKAQLASISCSKLSSYNSQKKHH